MVPQCSECDFATTKAAYLRQHVTRIHNREAKAFGMQETPKVSAEFLSSGEFVVKMLDTAPGQDSCGDGEFY